MRLLWARCEARELASKLMMGAPGPVLTVFVSAARVQFLERYVEHARSILAKGEFRAGIDLVTGCSLLEMCFSQPLWSVLRNWHHGADAYFAAEPRHP